MNSVTYIITKILYLFSVLNSLIVEWVSKENFYLKLRVNKVK